MTTLITTQAGVYTERQAIALLTPCRHAREWGPGDYRRITQRGQVELLTFLTFDWFADSKPCWHAAVAIMVGPARLKAVAQWDHNDQSQAILIATELLGQAGDVKRGRWGRKTTDGLDIYRAATPEEALLAQQIIAVMAPLPPFINVDGIPELEEMVYAGRDDGRRGGEVLGADGSRTEAAQGNGKGSGETGRRRVIAERLGE